MNHLFPSIKFSSSNELLNFRRVHTDGNASFCPVTNPLAADATNPEPRRLDHVFVTPNVITLMKAKVFRPVNIFYDEEKLEEARRMVKEYEERALKSDSNDPKRSSLFTVMDKLFSGKKVVTVKKVEDLKDFAHLKDHLNGHNSANSDHNSVAPELLDTNGNIINEHCTHLSDHYPVACKIAVPRRGVHVRHASRILDTIKEDYEEAAAPEKKTVKKRSTSYKSKPLLSAIFGVTRLDEISAHSSPKKMFVNDSTELRREDWYGFAWGLPSEEELVGKSVGKQKQTGSFFQLVESIRKQHDSRYHTWPPHVTIFPPIIRLDDTVISMQHLETLWFCLDIDPCFSTQWKLGTLSHGSTASVVLYPVGEAKRKLLEVYQKLDFALPVGPSTLKSIYAGEL